MANHTLLTTKRNLTNEILSALLQEINVERFEGKLEIKQTGDMFEIIIADGYGRQVWLRSKRTIELRHGAGGDLFHWIAAVFLNDLSLKLKGALCGEFGGSKWQGEPNKYPSLRSWCEESWSMCERSFAEKLIAKYCIWRTLSNAKEDRPDLADVIEGTIDKNSAEPTLDEINAHAEKHGFIGGSETRPTIDIESMCHEWDWDSKSKVWIKKDEAKTNGSSL